MKVLADTLFKAALIIFFYLVFSVPLALLH